MELPEHTREMLFGKYEESKIDGVLQKIHDLISDIKDTHVIQDRFTNHTERRAWRTALELKYGDDVYDTVGLKNNKLRYGVLHIQMMRVERLTNSYQGIYKEQVTKQYQRMLEFIRSLPTNQYDRLSFDEKVAHIYKIEDCVIEIIKTILRKN